MLSLHPAQRTGPSPFRNKEAWAFRTSKSERRNARSVPGASDAHEQADTGALEQAGKQPQGRNQRYRRQDPAADIGQRRFPPTSSAPKHMTVSNFTARANDRPAQTGEPCWIRTSDLLIKSQLLYRLS